LLLEIMMAANGYEHCHLETDDSVVKSSDYSVETIIHECVEMITGYSMERSKHDSMEMMRDYSTERSTHDSMERSTDCWG
jgi:hypothetical protein